MESRTLGRTGVRVSKLCLGVDVRPLGQSDHEESIRANHRALEEVL
jgi:aryl-alcohol dehydrogenase-like predicted oxidoreductase